MFHDTNDLYTEEIVGVVIWVGDMKQRLHIAFCPLMSGKLIKCRIIRHHCEFLFVDTTTLTLTQHISLHCHLFSPQFKTSVTLQKVNGPHLC